MDCHVGFVGSTTSYQLWTHTSTEIICSVLINDHAIGNHSDVKVDNKNWLINYQGNSSGGNLKEFCIQFIIKDKHFKDISQCVKLNDLCYILKISCRNEYVPQDSKLLGPFICTLTNHITYVETAVK